MFSPRRAAHFGLAGVGLLLVTSLGVLVAFTKDQDVLPEIRVGKPVPQFQLQDLNGRWTSLCSPQHQATVVFFTTPRDGVAASYAQRLTQLAQQYGQDDRVQIVAVQTDSEDFLEEIRTQARLNKSPFLTLLDPAGNVARAFEVRFTPTFFVIDAAGVLQYTGAFDDNQNPQQVKNHYCEDAIRRVLNGGAFVMASTHAFDNAARQTK